VARVDLTRRRLHIAESASEVGGRLVWTTTKNHQSRSVPVPPGLIPELARACEGKKPGDLVFTAPGGGPLRLGNWRTRVFDPACAAAGIVGLTPHDLRHTAASLAIAAGANVKAVQRMLGHSSAAMTLDIYAGLFGDDLDTVAALLDSHVPQMRHSGEIEAADGGRNDAA
jgi:integrase